VLEGVGAVVGTADAGAAASTVAPLPAFPLDDDGRHPTTAIAEATNKVATTDVSSQIIISHITS
jgi:hypothetical protein